MRHIANLVVVLSLCVPSAQVLAQDTASHCARPGPVPAELAAWEKQQPLKAAQNMAATTAAMLTPGQAVLARLAPVSGVRFAVPPQKPGGKESHAGLFAFDVRQAGTYRVATGASVWIDVLRGGAAVASTSHGHGPECSPVSKTVDFPLQPGRHVLQIAGSTAPELALMVQRLP